VNNPAKEMRLLFLASLLISSREEVFSFAPAVFLKNTRTAKLMTRPVSTSPGAENSSAFVTRPESIADKNSSASAVKALEKLLARQKSEVEETERLLERFTSPTDTNPGSDVVKRSLSTSTAASIMSGFDYGFVSRSEGASFSELKGGSPAFEGYGPPANIFSLGTQQLFRNWNAILGEYKDEDPKNLTPKQKVYQDKLDVLTLSSENIWVRELADGPIVAPFVIKIPYLALCYMLDTVFEGKYVFSRFFLLETVARMPYFAYITMLHLYETLGFWRRSADMKRIHFAEEINEFNHLLIMESLGGDQSWWVRFMAQHSAIIYFFVLCHLWALSPSLSYQFSELLETHAVNTYGEFLDENEAVLKKLPPSLAAVQYYSFGSSDPFYAEFQTTAVAEGHEVRSLAPLICQGPICR
jgi:ubiquinol oxidase